MLNQSEITTKLQIISYKIKSKVILHQYHNLMIEYLLNNC